MTFLECLNSPKFDFTQNQSGGRIIKYQQINFTFWKFLEHSALWEIVLKITKFTLNVILSLNHLICFCNCYKTFSKTVESKFMCFPNCEAFATYVSIQSKSLSWFITVLAQIIIWYLCTLSFTISQLYSNRPCFSCGKKFGSSRGLDMHHAEKKDCGKVAKKIRKAEQVKALRLRNKNIHSLSLRRIGPHKKLSKPHRRGTPLTRQEKEMVLHYYDLYRSKTIFFTSDGSVNSLSRKIHVWKQFLTFHGIKFDFSFKLWNLMSNSRDFGNFTWNDKTIC